MSAEQPVRAVRALGLTANDGGGWAVIYEDGEAFADRLPSAGGPAGVDIDAIMARVHRPATLAAVENAVPAHAFTGGVLVGALDAAGIPVRVVSARCWTEADLRRAKSRWVEVPFLRQHRLLDKRPFGVVAALHLAQELADHR